MAHKTRWHLDLPDRAGTLRYMADVLARQEELLGRGVSDEARYFYELSIRHEDMHIEAQAYMRQTSSNAPPHGLGNPVRPGAARWPATPWFPVDAGAWARPARKNSFSITRSGGIRSSWRRSVSRAPP